MVIVNLIPLVEKKEQAVNDIFVHVTDPSEHETITTFVHSSFPIPRVFFADKTCSFLP
ncbi:unnamed protein product [Meloidogyne enterolobii]|uniref:Uncharacterized protein n=1 Tax=Meloidogyne enterolobii TaxID=390850 RepID=A0ACB1A821_MELEN